MIIDLPLNVDNIRKAAGQGRPLRMGFFHFSNNNLSIRKQCARDLGMYDLNAVKSEDVELCFRLARSPKWVAWREDAAVVRHKGRRTLWQLIRQMWGWGRYVGYPYARTGIRGVYFYWIDSREHDLAGRFETARFPILVCIFGCDFYLVNGLGILAVMGAASGHLVLSALAALALVWPARGYFADLKQTGLSPWGTVKLAVVHYLTNVAFTVASFVGALRYRVILIPSSIFRPNPTR